MKNKNNKAQTDAVYKKPILNIHYWKNTKGWRLILCNINQKKTAVAILIPSN